MYFIYKTFWGWSWIHFLYIFFIRKPSFPVSDFVKATAFHKRWISFSKTKWWIYCMFQKPGFTESWKKRNGNLISRNIFHKFEVISSFIAIESLKGLKSEKFHNGTINSRPKINFQPLTSELMSLQRGTFVFLYLAVLCGFLLADNKSDK